jgi:pimeloyl-ACP methyl ester carboxylesterase
MTTIPIFLFAYIIITICLTYAVHKMPRKPVCHKPGWGKLVDTKIAAVDGGFLEVWRIDPDGPSKGIVVLAHGWSRNRDRMINRAQMFGKWGYSTVVHSARDHGGSSPCRWMNGIRFGEDIETILQWIGEPVILYGHSAGAAGAMIAASRYPHLVELLFLEGCYAEIKPALLNLYKSFNKYFGTIFGPGIVFWMVNVLYRNQLKLLSPKSLAPGINIPVMLIHGEKDMTFPVSFARDLANSFPGDRVKVWIAGGAGHSNASLKRGYRNEIKQFLNSHKLS